MNIIRKHAQMVQPAPSGIPMTDEDDRIFYDTAKQAGAQLITGNIKHYPNEPFILTPAQFWDSIFSEGNT